MAGAAQGPAAEEHGAFVLHAVGLGQSDPIISGNSSSRSRSTTKRCGSARPRRSSCATSLRTSRSRPCRSPPERSPSCRSIRYTATGAIGSIRIASIPAVFLRSKRRSGRAISSCREPVVGALEFLGEFVDQAECASDLLADVAEHLEAERVLLRGRQRVVWFFRADRDERGPRGRDLAGSADTPSLRFLSCLPIDRTSRVAHEEIAGRRRSVPA
jgi:hypothetical protein